MALPMILQRSGFFILRMMETALTKGPDFAVKNARVDGMIEEMPQTGEDELQAQIQKTGSAFAVDMLLLKFVQGFPLVGILGGAANPVYYNKVMRYVQLKYQKRYLLAVAQRNGYSLRFLGKIYRLHNRHELIGNP